MSYALSSVLFRLGFTNLWKLQTTMKSEPPALYLVFRAAFWYFGRVLLTYKVLKFQSVVFIYFYYYRYNKYIIPERKKTKLSWLGSVEPMKPFFYYIKNIKFDWFFVKHVWLKMDWIYPLGAANRIKVQPRPNRKYFKLRRIYLVKKYKKPVDFEKELFLKIRKKKKQLKFKFNKILKFNKDLKKLNSILIDKSNSIFYRKNSRFIYNLINKRIKVFIDKIVYKYKKNFFNSKKFLRIINRLKLLTSKRFNSIRWIKKWKIIIKISGIYFFNSQLNFQKYKSKVTRKIFNVNIINFVNQLCVELKNEKIFLNRFVKKLKWKKAIKNQIKAVENLKENGLILMKSKIMFPWINTIDLTYKEIIKDFNKLEELKKSYKEIYKKYRFIKNIYKKKKSYQLKTHSQRIIYKKYLNLYKNTVWKNIVVTCRQLLKKRDRILEIKKNLKKIHKLKYIYKFFKFKYTTFKKKKIKKNFSLFVNYVPFSKKHIIHQQKIIKILKRLIKRIKKLNSKHQQSKFSFNFKNISLKRKLENNTINKSNSIVNNIFKNPLRSNLKYQQSKFPFNFKKSLKSKLVNNKINKSNIVVNSIYKSPLKLNFKPNKIKFVKKLNFYLTKKELKCINKAKKVFNKNIKINKLIRITILYKNKEKILCALINKKFNKIKWELNFNRITNYWRKNQKKKAVKHRSAEYKKLLLMQNKIKFNINKIFKNFIYKQIDKKNVKYSPFNYKKLLYILKKFKILSNFHYKFFENIVFFKDLSSVKFKKNKIKQKKFFKSKIKYKVKRRLFKKTPFVYLDLRSKWKNLKLKLKKPVKKLCMLFIQRNLSKLLLTNLAWEKKLISSKEVYNIDFKPIEEGKFVNFNTISAQQSRHWFKRQKLVLYYKFLMKKVKLKKKMKVGAKSVRLLALFIGKDLDHRVLRFRNILKFNIWIEKAAYEIQKTYWFFRQPILLFFYTTLIIAKLLNSAFLLNFGLHKIFLNVYQHSFILKNFLMIWKSFFKDKSGIKLAISGKWFGRMRAKKKVLAFKITKRQSIGHYVDYHNSNVITKYGIFSIKTWVNCI